MHIEPRVSPNSTGCTCTYNQISLTNLPSESYDLEQVGTSFLVNFEIAWVTFEIVWFQPIGLSEGISHNN